MGYCATHVVYATTVAQPGILMNLVLWAAQVVLAALFLAHGIVYLFPPASLREAIHNGPLPRRLVYAIGAAEVLAAVGLTVPPLTGVAPLLVPLAAAGLVLLMVGAVLFHISRAEVPPAIVTLLLGALAAFVAYGRWTVFHV